MRICRHQLGGAAGEGARRELVPVAPLRGLVMAGQIFAVCAVGIGRGPARRFSPVGRCPMRAICEGVPANAGSSRGEKQQPGRTCRRSGGVVGCNNIDAPSARESAAASPSICRSCGASRGVGSCGVQAVTARQAFTDHRGQLALLGGGLLPGWTQRSSKT